VSGRVSPLVVWRNSVRDSEQLGWTARLVAFVLSTHMDADGGSCFPSITTLTRETHLARRTVCYALDELERERFIERVRQGRGRPTRYRATSASGALVEGAQLVHDVHQLVHVVHPTSACGAPEDVQEDVQQDVHKPSMRAQARARKRRGGARADGAHPDSNYLDQGAQ
jgi:hypothetical protein